MIDRNEEDEDEDDDGDGDGGRGGGKRRVGTRHHPRATFFVMGGVRSDSRTTGRGESTSPCGYADPEVVARGGGGRAAETAEASTDRGGEDGRDDDDDDGAFGEFNFALDVDSVRRSLLPSSSSSSSSSDDDDVVAVGVRGARILTVEACTLVPDRLRPTTTTRGGGGGASAIAFLGERALAAADAAGDRRRDRDDDPSPRRRRELRAAIDVLRGLLVEFGTAETQWDSIAAAVYCNAFGNANPCRLSSGDDDNDDDDDDDDDRGGGGEGSTMPSQVDAREMSVSDSGVLSFPGCRSLPFDIDDCDDGNDAGGRRGRAGGGVGMDGEDDVDDGDDAYNNDRDCHWIYPDFTLDDEIDFFRYVSDLLRSE